MSFSQQEIEEFKVEALELLDLAEKSVLALDAGAEFRASFDTIFRGFHNLKGGAGMMELLKLQAHTHELENILMGFKNESSIPKEYLSLFLRGIDAARTLLDGKEVSFSFAVNTSAETPPVAAAPQTAETHTDELASLVPQNVEPLEEEKTEVAAVEEALPQTEQALPQATLEVPDSAVEEFVVEGEEIVERISSSLQGIEKNDYNKDSIDALYRDAHSLKGTAYLFSYADLGDLAHAMESSLEQVRAGTHSPSSELLDALFKSLKVVESLLGNIRKKKNDPHQKAVIEALAKALGLAAANLKPAAALSPDKTEEKSTMAASTIIPPVSPDVAMAPTPPAATPSAPPPAESSSASQAKDKEPELSSVRVPVALLDNLMTLMGEMVLVRNQVLQHSSKSEDLELLSMSKRLNLVTSEIQGEMMKTRMQPVSNILSKFNRVTRDLSLELKKKINLVLTGAETEIDKSLLEAIKDPLTHIVRNSCDHGIENPDQRLKAGKTESGTITIKAYHEGGQVIIEVSDDGKGLHKDVLLRKALEKGLITEQQASKMTEKEIFNLIFAPGFSTAAKITNVSGRGVGMDVVRTNVERIGGFVDLTSVPGKGTSIKLKIPLTLAIIPALIVKCGKGTFAIPQVKLEELVRVDQSVDENKIEFLHGVPVYRLRGNILPLVDMNKLLKVKTDSETNYENATFNIAVLSAETSSFGVIIDEIKDTADIVVKPLNRVMKALQIYSGATILGDGSIALILDVLGISKVAKIGNHGKSGEHRDAALEKAKQNSENQDFLLVRLNSPTRHAIVLGYVHRMEEFKLSSVELSGNQRVIRYRDIILPLISVNEILGYEQKATNKETIPVVVIQRAAELYGLVVDEIVDTLSTTVDLSTSQVRHPGILGNLNTKDELVVVVDPFELVSRAFPQSESTSTPLQALSQAAAPSLLPSPEPVTNISDNAASLKAKRILLVEDTVFFRKAIKTVLEKGGFEVFTANNGEEALTALGEKNLSVDMIVSDIEMPRLNGFQLAAAIRKHPDFSALPMLAISSRADQKYIRDGVKAGFDIYLEKLKPVLLLEAVNGLLKKGRNAA